MVNIKGQEIPSNKNISIALTYIYGIGRTRAEEVVKECAINPHTKTKDLSEEQMEQISRVIGKYTIGNELRSEINQVIDAEIKLGSWKGKRRSQKPNPLPIRGQRTRHNARTAKKGGKTTRKVVAVAGKKRAPAPK